jgi:hypothetical protein
MYIYTVIPHRTYALIIPGVYKLRVHLTRYCILLAIQRQYGLNKGVQSFD